MKITETKVKTLYTIKLDLADFALILEHFHSDRENCDPILCVCKTAFDWLAHTSADVSESRAETVIQQLYSDAKADTYTYIAKTLGFDGWENAGYYDGKKKIYTMVVYNNGDTLNA
jgi:hypothetical protein